jgi:hypothetical protein
MVQTQPRLSGESLLWCAAYEAAVCGSDSWRLCWSDSWRRRHRNETAATATETAATATLRRKSIVVRIQSPKTRTRRLCGSVGATLGTAMKQRLRRLRRLSGENLLWCIAQDAYETRHCNETAATAATTATLSGENLLWCTSNRPRRVRNGCVGATLGVRGGEYGDSPEKIYCGAHPIAQDASVWERERLLASAATSHR